MSKIEKVIPALDNLDSAGIKRNLEILSKDFSTVKIGLEAYLAYGKDFVKEICDEYGVEIFLDLKLHDIPNTVSKAIKSLSGLKLKFLTIHTSGGTDMIKAALDSAQAHLKDVSILGVTVLTSIDAHNNQNIFSDSETKDSVLKLVELSNTAGLNKFVCSAAELEFLDCKNNHFITPGIRFLGDSNDDQRRVMDPKSAFKLGAHHLVMGRSIVGHPEYQQRISELKSIL